MTPQTQLSGNRAKRLHVGAKTVKLLEGHGGASIRGDALVGDLVERTPKTQAPRTQLFGLPQDAKLGGIEALHQGSEKTTHRMGDGSFMSRRGINAQNRQLVQLSHETVRGKTGEGPERPGLQGRHTAGQLARDRLFHGERECGALLSGGRRPRAHRMARPPRTQRGSHGDSSAEIPCDPACPVRGFARRHREQGVRELLVLRVQGGREVKGPPCGLPSISCPGGHHGHLRLGLGGRGACSWGPLCSGVPSLPRLSLGGPPRPWEAAKPRVWRSGLSTVEFLRRPEAFHSNSVS